MKLLHTSDWHLGRSLHGRKRYEEFDRFLNWLLQTVQAERIDTLIIAGDIFDTTTPSNRAQAQYYRFLHQVAASACRHVVVIAGNHDSPTLLDAPRELLKALDIHVVGQASANPADEVLVLHTPQGQPELILCAVPYLRDRDLRTVQAGESLQDKDQRLIQGLYAHYEKVIAHAGTLRKTLGKQIPIIGTGHLFTAGGQTLDDDGVRELYVGNLAHVGADLFGPDLNYVALGHLHVPQVVGGKQHIRYSGSPLPMGFGEANQQKSACCVTFDGLDPKVDLLPIPRFQRLERLRGDWPQLKKTLEQLCSLNESIWVELTYDGHEPMADLRQQVETIVQDSAVEVLRLGNRRLMETALARLHDSESLDTLTPEQVFERCLDANNIAPDNRADLWAGYRQTLQSLQNDDPNAL